MDVAPTASGLSSSPKTRLRDYDRSRVLLVTCSTLKHDRKAKISYAQRIPHPGICSGLGLNKKHAIENARFKQKYTKRQMGAS